MKRYNILIATVFLFCCSQNEENPTYKNSGLDTETRVADLLSRMTLEEKIRELDMYSAHDLIDNGKLSIEKAKPVLDGLNVGSVRDFYPESAELSNELQKFVIENNRLGIPILIIEEALHGYLGKGSTSFPVPIGMASMWDVEAMEKIGKVIGSEARSVGVHLALAPTLGLGREPRWGRVQETYGEDPYLAARKGVAIIKGMQGDDLSDDDAIVAEPKHFGIHSIPEGGKNTAPVYIGEREARSNFLYVFEKAYKEAGALGAMAAYHEWDGVPAAGDRWLLHDLLREEWGFKGMVISDLGAIAKQEFIHKTVKNSKEAIASSIKAGLDMQFYDYKHDVFRQGILDALDENLLSMEDVDRGVSSVLYVKFRLGLFDNPYIDTTLKSARYGNKQSQELALEAAHKSIVLLQNKDNVLPFDASVKKVAVIGEMANKALLGGYSRRGENEASIIEAFQKTDYEIDFVDVGVPGGIMEEIDERFLETADGEVGLKAEYFTNPDFSGKPSLTQTETKLENYWHNLSPAPGIPSDNFSIRWTGYLIPKLNGVYDFQLWADDLGRLIIGDEVLIDSWDVKYKNSWSKKSMRLQKDKKYPIKMELTEYDEFADIKIRWKINPDENRETMFEKAVKAAKNADVTVLVLGEKDGNGEGRDKVRLELNQYSKRLLREVAATGKPIVLVLQNGRPLVLTEEVALADAIVETWYAGEEAAQGTVDILSGKVNPSGKLPISFPRANAQLPIYYNQKKSANAGYVDESIQPLFAFGHGLSYSSFEYTDIRVEKPEMSPNEEQKVWVKIKNTSKVKGTEVAQLYITDSYSSVGTPKIQLRGFQRVDLEPGEAKEIEFTLLPDDLSLWNMKMKRVVESGEFIVQVGAASNDIRLKTEFEVKD
ncbi:glycoside hydrolase family 3 C-terminal domain-containing protein [Flagellimonas sp. HMM57]|uniref:glycoside hydrolase family 3 N-terminal domain-containing protein n=1 Tax=unclassified Flagellimonas TaxID=2644544 RepID=UPI0013D729F4|nr:MULTISPECIES: glycoside hydrolase family 3 N-terminal domain-containing protein [unclassified Flagellimonas]UII74773.1 glycoside hydrolase family 3 C-terminal domain-containing protein [Flagellimonas sp. HMM57]